MNTTAADTASKFRDNYTDGWLIRARGDQSARVTLQELSRLFRTGELTAADLVWHDRAGRWLTMRDVLHVLGPVTGQPAAAEGAKADQSLLQRLSRGPAGPIRNTIYLCTIAGAALFFLWVIASLMSNNEGGSIVLMILIADMYLWWWAWLEFKGISLEEKQVYFPMRLPFWPLYAPYRMTRLNVASIRSASYSSSGNLSHFLLLKTEEKAFRMVFDSPLARDMMLVLLSLRQVPITRS